MDNATSKNGRKCIRQLWIKFADLMPLRIIQKKSILERLHFAVIKLQTSETDSLNWPQIFVIETERGGGEPQRQPQQLVVREHRLNGPLPLVQQLQQDCQSQNIFLAMT
jgi:hypothetical protein